VATNQLCAKRVALVLVPPLYQFFPVGPLKLAFHTAFLPAVAAAQHLSRRVTVTNMRTWCKCQVHIRRLWQPPQHNLGDGPLWREHGIPLTKDGKPWDVIDTARFAAYASIGWTVAEPAPRLFAWLGW
jgi:hypothetical protein